MTQETPKSFGIGQKIMDTAPRYERVEKIRQRLMAMDYERDHDVEKLRYGLETAVVASFHEGYERSDEKKAFDEMLLEMRVPTGELHAQLVKDWLAEYLVSPEAQKEAAAIRAKANG